MRASVTPRDPSEAPYVHPATYKELLASLNHQLVGIEGDRPAQDFRSLQDCMYHLHVSWQTFNSTVRDSRLVCSQTGIADLEPVSITALDLMAELAMFVLELGRKPKVMTKTQAVTKRGRQDTPPPDDDEDDD